MSGRLCRAFVGTSARGVSDAGALAGYQMLGPGSGRRGLLLSLRPFDRPVGGFAEVEERNVVYAEVDVIDEAGAQADQFCACEVADEQRVLQRLAEVDCDLVHVAEAASVADVVRQEEARSIRDLLLSGCQGAVVVSLAAQPGGEQARLKLKRAAVGGSVAKAAGARMSLRGLGVVPEADVDPLQVGQTRAISRAR